MRRLPKSQEKDNVCKMCSAKGYEDMTADEGYPAVERSPL